MLNHPCFFIRLLVCALFLTMNLVPLADTFDSLSRVIKLDPGNSWNTSVATGDIDQDGNIDIVVGRYGEQNEIYISLGSGKFHNKRIKFGTETNKTNSIALADLDGDGVLDIIEGNEGKNVIYYTKLKTKPLDNSLKVIDSFAHSFFDKDILDTRVILPVDIDGDKDLDIITGNYGKNNLVYTNIGLSPNSNHCIVVDFATKAFGTGTDLSNALSVYDYNKDDNLDIAVGNDGQNVIYVGPVFDAPVNFGTVDRLTRSLSHAYIDNDNKMDLVEGNYQARNTVYLGEGAGNFIEGDNSFWLSDDSTNSLFLGDFDNSGRDRDDIIGGNENGDIIYYNNGDGIFSVSETLGISTDWTTSITAADLDKDGDLDIIASMQNGPIKIFYNPKMDVVDTRTRLTERFILEETTNEISRIFTLDDNRTISKFWFSHVGGFDVEDWDIFSSNGNLFQNDTLHTRQQSMLFHQGDVVTIEVELMDHILPSPSPATENGLGLAENLNSQLHPNYLLRMN